MIHTTKLGMLFIKNSEIRNKVNKMVRYYFKTT